MQQPEGGTMSKILEVCMLLSDENIALRVQLEEQAVEISELEGRLKSEASKAYQAIEVHKEKLAFLRDKMGEARDTMGLAIEKLGTASKQIQLRVSKKKKIAVHPGVAKKLQTVYDLLSSANTLAVESRNTLIGATGTGKWRRPGDMESVHNMVSSRPLTNEVDEPQSAHDMGSRFVTRPWHKKQRTSR